MGMGQAGFKSTLMPGMRLSGLGLAKIIGLEKFLLMIDPTLGPS